MASLSEKLPYVPKAKAEQRQREAEKKAERLSKRLMLLELGIKIL